ncbi:hypothetical protein ACFX15_024088 [Malus domestica]
MRLSKAEGEDRCEIKKIYFGKPDLPDRLIWLADKKGNYSVKSGSRWVYDRGGKWRAQRPSSFCPTNPFVWKQGNWRVVATTLSLFRRKCSTSPLCPICDEHDESVVHLILLCHWVEVMWFGGLFSFRINHASIVSLDI